MRIKIVYLLAFFLMASYDLSYAERLYPFQGQLDVKKRSIDIKLQLPQDQGADEKSSRSVLIKAFKTANNQYRFSIHLEHLQTPIFDLSSKVEGSIKVDKSNGNAHPLIRGEIWSRYSLYDFKPIRELSGRFEIKDYKLYLDKINYGQMALNGKISLIDPYRMDLKLNLTAIDMNDFLDFWNKNRKYQSNGDVSGTIKISGAIDRLLLKGNLESRNGFIKKLFYDSILLNIEGEYPNMVITQSPITETGGLTYSVNGPIDLSDSENFKKQIKALTISPLVHDSATQREWTIMEKQEESGTTAIKYLLRKEDLAGSDAQGSDMLGIEKSMEF